MKNALIIFILSTLIIPIGYAGDEIGGGGGERMSAEIEFEKEFIPHLIIPIAMISDIRLISETVVSPEEFLKMSSANKEKLNKNSLVVDIDNSPIADIQLINGKIIDITGI